MHELCDYKEKVCVLSNGLTTESTENFAGLLSDFEIIEHRLQWDEKLLRQSSLWLW